MRVFIALMPDARSVERIDQFSVKEAGWHHRLDLHMTLKFLGDKNTAQVSTLIDALNSCECNRAIDWVGDKLDYFPEVKKPKVWAIEGPATFELQQLLIELELIPLLNTEKSVQTFRPHISLCATKYVDEVFSDKIEFDQMILKFDRVVLMQSVSASTLIGPRYRVLWQRNLSN